MSQVLSIAWFLKGTSIIEGRLAGWAVISIKEAYFTFDERESISACN